MPGRGGKGVSGEHCGTCSWGWPLAAVPCSGSASELEEGEPGSRRWCVGCHHPSQALPTRLTCLTCLTCLSFQFQLYCVYFLILSIIYFLGAMLDGLRHCQRGHHRPLPPAQDLRSPVEEKAAQVLSVQDKGLGGLQPAQSLPLSPEDGLGTLGPASLEQRQSDPAPAPALQAAGFLSPVTAPSACTPCSAQASGPDTADETCPQPAVHPGVSKLGLQRHPSDSVQNVNQ